ncbi:MAG: hypothetical protein MUE68_04515 [Bacteroidetes bacterium]|jgi:D-alanyl-D-alanine dipeptidase|nr:hypothetical protein [Bacteroidota bacterium]
MFATRSIASIVLATLFVACSSTELHRPAGFRDPLARAQQLVVVRTASWDTSGGTLTVYQRAPQGSWTIIGTPYAITVGTTGLGWGTGLHGAAMGSGPVKREGDKRSPAGVFALSAVYGNAGAQEMADLAMPYLPLDSTTVCVDDPRSRYYNQIVDRNNVRDKDWTSAERMRSNGPWYRWGVVVDHNADPRIPGDGSCIFLHVWGYAGEPTTGCTSFAEEDMVRLLRWLRPSAHPALVQLPASEYQRLKSSWNLP